MQTHKRALLFGFALACLAPACGSDDDDDLTAADAGATGGDPATGGTTPNPDDPLAGADGITGTFDGVAHAFTINPIHVPQQTPTALIGASNAQFPPIDSWALRFLPEVGTQRCNGADGESDPAVSYRSTASLDLNGTTGTLGDCEITVTAVAPKFEGSFTATIPTSGGELVVTEGAFRVAN